ASAEDGAGVPGPLRAAWAAACRRLLALPLATDTTGGPSPRLVGLTESGRQAWRDWTAAHAAEVNDADFPPHLLGPWSKLRGYCGRLALVLHALRWAAGGQPAAAEADGDTVRAAGRLTAYFKGHARKVWGALEADPRLAGAQRILRWLREHPQVNEVK